ncbi:hypothetical protein N7475_005482 [Penicillium sp. IBT 31633x]|nr:hypothetical protein N7475_005482 [Penicillium sp. IBT 31633x]
MGSLLVRGWILAAFFLQIALAVTVTASKPTVTPSPVGVAKHHHHHHHHHDHWSYIPRPLPSRKPCPARSSSVVLAPSVVPTSTPLLSHTLKPSPHHSSFSVSSSGAIQTNIGPISTPTIKPTSTSSKAIQSSIVSGSSTEELVTSTILSTRTATITACPTTVPNCPVNSKTTFVTTETILVSTTVCPATETAGVTDSATASPSVTSSAGGNGHGSGDADLIISTVYSTRTATVTACPSSVTNCPLKSKTTYLTTETLIVATTVCPVSGTTGINGAVPTEPTASSSVTGTIANGRIGPSQIITSTIFTTRTATVLACPESVTNCPLRSKTAQPTTEIIAVATATYPVYPVYTSLPAENINVPTAPVGGVNHTGVDVTVGSQPGFEGAGSGDSVGSGDSAGSGNSAGSGVSAGSVHTATIVVESCSDDDTCTGYINTIMVTQTNAMAPTVTPISNGSHQVTGTGGNNGAVSSSSARPWPLTSRPSGMATATISTTTSAITPLYTGTASAGARLSIVQVMGTLMVILLGIVI